MTFRIRDKNIEIGGFTICFTKHTVISLLPKITEAKYQCLNCKTELDESPLVGKNEEPAICIDCKNSGFQWKDLSGETPQNEEQTATDESEGVSVVGATALKNMPYTSSQDDSIPSTSKSISTRTVTDRYKGLMNRDVSTCYQKFLPVTTPTSPLIKRYITPKSNNSLLQLRLLVTNICKERKHPFVSVMVNSKKFHTIDLSKVQYPIKETVCLANILKAEHQEYLQPVRLLLLSPVMKYFIIWAFIYPKKEKQILTKIVANPDILVSKYLKLQAVSEVLSPETSLAKGRSASWVIDSDTIDVFIREKMHISIDM